MAYTFSKTTWNTGDMFTHRDMNRIIANVASMITTSLLPNYTLDDMLTEKDWRTLKNDIVRLRVSVGINYPIPEMQTVDANTINQIEMMVKLAYERVLLKAKQKAAVLYTQKNAFCYLGEQVYTRG